MADNQAIREGTGKLTLVRSVELEGGIHIPVYALADAEGNLLGTASAPLPVSVEGGITIGDITLSNVEISNDIGNPIPVSAAQLPVSLGAKTAAESLPVTLSTDGALPAGANAIGKLTTLPGLDIPAHDYVACSYTGSDLTGVIYKTGGSGGTTVAALTLAYTDGKLVSVTKS